MSSSLKSQLTFEASSGCDSFEVNKIRLNLPRGSYVCLKCSCSITEHQSAVVSEQDVAGYLAHLSGKDGATCILERCPEKRLDGSVYVGTYAASINPFVSKNSIGAIVNCSDLHLSDRADFQAWAIKVQDLEQKGIFCVMRLDWSDTESQRLWDRDEWDQLVSAVRFIHFNRQEGKNVVVHCAQGKSRSGAVAIAYVLATHAEMDFERALKFVQSKRAIVDPNPSFVAQLKAFGVSKALATLREELSS